jgi:hypothetical protein
MITDRFNRPQVPHFAHSLETPRMFGVIQTPPVVHPIFFTLDDQMKKMNLFVHEWNKGDLVYCETYRDKRSNEINVVAVLPKGWKLDHLDPNLHSSMTPRRTFINPKDCTFNLASEKERNNEHEKYMWFRDIPVLKDN